jgi:hypothetical protein
MQPRKNKIFVTPKSRQAPITKDSTTIFTAVAATSYRGFCQEKRRRERYRQHGDGSLFANFRKFRIPLR